MYVRYLQWKEWPSYGDLADVTILLVIILILPNPCRLLLRVSPLRQRLALLNEPDQPAVAYAAAFSNRLGTFRGALDVRSQGVVCRVSDEPMRLLGPGFADVLVGGEAP